MSKTVEKNTATEGLLSSLTSRLEVEAAREAAQARSPDLMDNEKAFAKAFQRPLLQVAR